MEPIKLTKEQEEKLLEMCNKLFPERSWDITSEILDLDENEPGCFSNTITYCEYGKDIDKYSETIHWFEFAFTYLLNAVAFASTKSDILADIEYEGFRMKMITDMFQDKLSPSLWHPIDYLYDQFIKLKL